MKIFLFILLVFIGYVAPSGYTCPGPGAMKFNPPNDLSKVFYWPSIWNDTLPPIPISSQQSCKWEIEVPEGLYASVVFYKDAPSDVSFAVTYPDGSIEGLNNKDYYPYIFTSPKFFITLYKSKSQAAFSFKVLWSKCELWRVESSDPEQFKDPELVHDNLKLVSGDKPTAMSPNNHLTTFTADSTISLVGFGLKNQSDYVYLRQSAVFDGDSNNAKFLGTLYRIMIQRQEKISSGKSLTVYTWDLNNVFDYTLYMVQDKTNKQGFYTYRGENCNENYDCQYQISAVYGVSVLATSDNHSEFVKSISTFPDGASLKVYEGAISDDTLVTVLTKQNYQSRLPMELKNTIRQYVLDSGMITGFTITRDSTSANWNKVYDGRKGFVHSFYHGISSNQQDTNETFVTGKNQKLYFNYYVKDADFTGDATTLTVTVLSDGNQISSSIYNSKCFPPATTTSIQGDSYNIKYETKGTITKGFRIDFSTTLKNASESYILLKSFISGYVPGTSTSRSLMTTTQKPTTTSLPFNSTSSIPISLSTGISTSETTQKNISTTSMNVIQTTTQSSSMNLSLFIMTYSLSLLI